MPEPDARCDVQAFTVRTAVLDNRCHASEQRPVDDGRRIATENACYATHDAA